MLNMAFLTSKTKTLQGHFYDISNLAFMQAFHSKEATNILIEYSGVLKPRLKFVSSRFHGIKKGYIQHNNIL